jgi:CDP-glycerol glycerophosphotransferase (TagB/SpsB family)
MADDLPAELRDWNILVKPHHFTMLLRRYRGQRKKLELWSRAENVHVARLSDYSLLPFLASADLLVSEASSAIFEFAALDRPIVWCDFLRLRLAYRGPLRFRFRRRMDPTILPFRDIAAHTVRYEELRRVVDQEMAHPERFRERRKECVAELVGVTDGKVSERIADHLLGA